MTKDRTLSKILIAFAVLLLLFFGRVCLKAILPVASVPAPFSTPTYIPVPEKSPPPVSAWEGVTIETICLQTEVTLNPNIYYEEVEGPLLDPIGETVRRYLTNMDVHIVDVGTTCDATMILYSKVEAFRGTYGYGGLSCYTGGSLETDMSLTREGQEAINLFITAKEPLSDTVTDLGCVEQPEDFLTSGIFTSFWDEQLLDFLYDIWGLQGLVYQLDDEKILWGNYGASDPTPKVITANMVFHRLNEIGPTDEVVLTLIYIFQSEDGNFRERATYLAGNFAPEAVETIPFLAQDVTHKWKDVRARARNALENFGPVAMDAVPQLIEAMDLYPDEKKDVSLVLQEITGQDFGVAPKDWQKWWDKNH